MSTVRIWARTHMRGLFVGICAGLMVLGIGSLVVTWASADPVASTEEVEATTSQLREDKAAAQQDLREKHQELLSQMSGADVERVERDRETVRDFVLDLAASSSTSRTVHDQQVSLDTRYEVLDSGSPVLTEFLPGWMASREGTVFTLRDLEVDVAGIAGLDYSYTITARLDPVSATGKTQYLFVTISTAQDGAITTAQAYQADSRSRDELLAADKAAEAGNAGDEG